MLLEQMLEQMRMNLCRIVPSCYRRPNSAGHSRDILFLEDKVILPISSHSFRVGGLQASRA